MWQHPITSTRRQHVLVFAVLVLSYVAAGQSSATPTLKIPVRPERMAIAETVVPEVYWLPASSAAELLKRYSLIPDPPSGEGRLVMSQSPAPGTRVPVGTHVRIGVGTPQLVLSVNTSTAGINQPLTFTLVLEPALPRPAGVTIMAFGSSPLQPNYSLDWGDGGSSSSQVPAVIHGYSKAGKFNVSAVAVVGPYRVSSNQVTVTVAEPGQTSTAYRVGLQVVPRSAKIGEPVRAMALVTPEPSGGAFYTFQWGDGQADNQASAFASHQYTAPEGTHYVQVLVTINDHDFRSNPIPILIIAPLATGGNGGDNSNPVVSPADEVAVPELSWLTSAEAGAVLQKYRLRPELPGAQSGVVISQNPQQGVRVPLGTPVTITLGQPQLSLSAAQSVAKINEDLTFVLNLEPAPPRTTLAHYAFNWNDGTNSASTDATAMAHRFNNPGTYDISATAQVGTDRIFSNQLTVTVESATPPTVSYKVVLQANTNSAEVGQPVQATAFVSPAPGAGVDYTFEWGDGSQPVRQQSPDATHTYNSPPGTHLVQAMVSINGKVVRSIPVQISITAATITTSDGKNQIPTWEIAVVVAIILIVLMGGFRLFRSRLPRRSPEPHSSPLPVSVSITGGFGVPTHVIQHAEQINKKPSLRIRAGSISSVSMEPSQVVAKKRSASNGGKRSYSQ